MKAELPFYLSACSSASLVVDHGDVKEFTNLCALRPLRECVPGVGFCRSSLTEQIPKRGEIHESNLP